jgi:hypothetical protein
MRGCTQVNDGTSTSETPNERIVYLAFRFESTDPADGHADNNRPRSSSE